MNDLTPRDAETLRLAERWALANVNYERDPKWWSELAESKSALIAHLSAGHGAEPDCWAVLTPNGSRLVSRDEAKGRKDAYPLYTAPQPAQDSEARVVYSPIAVDPHAKDGGRHPNDTEPTDPAWRPYLDDRGNGTGQGLSTFWKWGYAAGWNDHKRHAAAPPAPAQAEPLIDYSVVKEFADAWRIGYNETCSMVRAAIAASKGDTTPQEPQP